MKSHLYLGLCLWDNILSSKFDQKDLISLENMDSRENRQYLLFNKDEKCR